MFYFGRLVFHTKFLTLTQSKTNFYSLGEAMFNKQATNKQVQTMVYRRE